MAGIPWRFRETPDYDDYPDPRYERPDAKELAEEQAEADHRASLNYR